MHPEAEKSSDYAQCVELAKSFIDHPDLAEKQEIMRLGAAFLRFARPELKRLIVERGAVDSLEELRAEWARPDGVVEVNKGFSVTVVD
jgi:hypothetical protein